MIRKSVLSAIFIFVLNACGGGGENDNAEEEVSGIGTVRSLDTNYIDVTDSFDSLTLFQYNPNSQQILLRVNNPDRDDVASWALAIRTSHDPVGALMVEDIEVKLFETS